MSMPLPANAVKLGDNAYLFPSPSVRPVTDCFIVGHGGTPNDPKIEDKHFTVPAGCTVNFFVGGERSNVMNKGPVDGFTVMAGENGGRAPNIARGNSFEGGSNCRDYILAKAVGSHYEADPGYNTYSRINQALNGLAGDHAGLQWLPHYVSIRNRTSWFCSTNVWLSRVIKEIRAHDATIVNFYSANCRVYLVGDDAKKYTKSAGSQAFQ
jgi:hypothetical protein